MRMMGRTLVDAPFKSTFEISTLPVKNLEAAG